MNPKETQIRTLISDGVHDNSTSKLITDKLSTTKRNIYQRDYLLTHPEVYDKVISGSRRRYRNKRVKEIKAKDNFFTVKLTDKIIARVEFLRGRGRTVLDIAYMEGKPVPLIQQALKLIEERKHVKALPTVQETTHPV